jgi:hypothetical protein
MAIDHKAEPRRHRVEARHRAYATGAHTQQAPAHLRLVHPLPIAGRRRLASIVGLDGVSELFGGQLHALPDHWESIEVIVLPAP